MDHHATYMTHRDAPYGAAYVDRVCRFQEGFLRDRVCKDLDASFERAVEVCERLIPVIRIQAGR